MLGLIFSFFMVLLCLWQLNVTSGIIDVLWVSLLVINSITLGMNIVLCGEGNR